MAYTEHLLRSVADDVVRTFAVNWPYLLAGVVIAAAMRTYIGADRIQTALRGKTWATVPAAVLLATFTPFCSCGTTAVVLSMMAGSVPWAPIIAFMVSSPLTSPEELIISGGLFGWTFALTYFVGSSVLGLVAGFFTAGVERRGWLVGQARMRIDDATPASVGVTADACCSTQTSAVVGSTVPAGGVSAPLTTRAGASQHGAAAPAAGIGDGGAGGCCPPTVSTDPRQPRLPAAVLEPSTCCGPVAPAAGVPVPMAASGCCGTSDAAVDTTAVDRFKLRAFGASLWATGRRILLFFFLFASLGYLLIELIPSSVFTGLLGGDSPFAVVLTALLGIPVYLNSDASLPLVSSLINNGMGEGAAMAFLITGAGTSIGAITGALLIARWRVVVLIVTILFAGALVMGYGYQMLLAR